MFLSAKILLISYRSIRNNLLHRLAAFKFTSSVDIFCEIVDLFDTFGGI